MMLYHLHDWQRAALAPFRFAAEATQIAFKNPFMPTAHTRFGRAVAASAEVFERTTRHFAKPGFGLRTTRIAGKSVAVTEETVANRPFCNLLHFRRDADANDPKVLIVAPISGHHATLLRGTVEAMLPDHDVYITDWIDAKFVPL
ncbi:MAG: polyhydroxyalkanoate depolymerase, partial [Alphaproteobacteria bacterium]|nr:polyhydroxyalkanoate depolymerase [Alphaproteobacteria bacterium]